LSQISSTGRLVLYPKPTGYIKGSLNGIELGGFEGEARQAGVGLTGGIFDGTFDIRFQENGDMVTRSKFIMTDLELTEPPNGPIQTYVRTPAPLDIVIKALEDPSGSITIPINLNMKNGELTKGAVIGAGVG